MAAIEGALGDGIEQTKRRNDRACRQYLDAQVATCHVIHFLGEVLGVLVEDVLRWPGALPAHGNGSLRLCNHREAERCRAGRCSGSAGEELAPRCRGFCLLVVHLLSPRLESNYEQGLKAPR